MQTHFVNNWLTHARITDDPAGDLIADMRRDKTHVHADGDNVTIKPERGNSRAYTLRRYDRWLCRHPFGKTLKEMRIEAFK